jgi:hypothetical protein
MSYFKHHPAPAYAEWTIDQIRDQVDPSLVPRTDRVLGCGVFGCTMETPDPDWICKVTIDGSEAFLARALERIGLLAGVCRYLEPLHVDPPGGRIWVLWRSRVEMPTLQEVQRELRRGEPDWTEMRWSKLDEIKEAKQEPAPGPRKSKRGLSETEHDEVDLWWKHVDQLEAEWEHERGTDAYPILEALTQDGLGLAGALAGESADGSMDDFVRKLIDTSRAVLPRFAPSEVMHHWRYGDDSESLGYERAAFRLLGYGWQLGRLQDTVLVPELARGLRALYDAGVLMADLNDDNIAQLGGVWTLFDGGFCLPTSTDWVELWNQVGVVPSRWWNYSRWEPFATLGEPGIYAEGDDQDVVADAARMVERHGLRADQQGDSLVVSGFRSWDDAGKFVKLLRDMKLRAAVR